MKKGKAMIGVAAAASLAGIAYALWPKIDIWENGTKSPAYPT
jgi:hypothetical protein